MDTTKVRTIATHGALAFGLAMVAFVPAQAGEAPALHASMTIGAQAPSPAALAPELPEPSDPAATFSTPYRAIGAQHLYDTYQQYIYKGALPPLLYAIAITETEIDENGTVVDVVVTREPAAAKEVGAWAVSMIQAASPFPKPGPAGHTRFQEIWLVDKSLSFQLDTLTEGQR